MAGLVIEREALIEAGRQDLIGGCRVSFQPTHPRKLLRRSDGRPTRRCGATTITRSPTLRRARSRASGGAGPPKTVYRPGRKTQQRRQGKFKGGQKG